jgi:hypothetical protein
MVAVSASQREGSGTACLDMRPTVARDSIGQTNIYDLRGTILLSALSLFIHARLSLFAENVGANTFTQPKCSPQGLTFKGEPQPIKKK